MKIDRISEGTVVFDEGGVRFFLLIGKTRAILIDSGMQTRDADRLAKEYTDLPLELINTHADMDHIGSNGNFAEFYMHPSECVNYFQNPERKGFIKPVWDGDIIDLGDRPLEIISLPGHTPGSVAILDINNRALFSGDPIQDGRIFMFGPYRDMHAYIISLRRLETMKDKFDLIYPSHGSYPIKKEAIPKLIQAAEDILAGKIKGSETEIFGGKKVILYETEIAGFLCDRI